MIAQITSLLKKYSTFIGPGALAIGALGVAGAICLQDFLTLKNSRSKLYTSLQDIDIHKIRRSSESSEVKREKLIKGLTYIKDYMVQGTEAAGGSEKEDHNDRRNIVYDYNGLSKIVKILSSEEYKEDTEVVVAALKVIYLVIKAGPQERQGIRENFTKLGGIEILLNYIFNTEIAEEVREEAAMALRRASYVDYYKKDFVQDTPYGCSAVFRILRNKKSLEQLVELLGSLNSTGKINMGVLGTLVHISHISEGARVLSEMKVVEKLIKHINDPKQELCVASIFGIATISVENVQPDAQILLDERVLTNLLKMVTGKHGSKVMKRVGDIIYALAMHLTYKGIYGQEEVIEKRNLVGKILRDNQHPTIQLFTLMHSANAEGKSRAYKIRYLFTQKSFCPQYYKEIRQLCERADSLVEQENERKKKSMIPGMGDVSPEMLQMLSGMM